MDFEVGGVVAGVPQNVLDVGRFAIDRRFAEQRLEACRQDHRQSGCERFQHVAPEGLDPRRGMEIDIRVETAEEGLRRDGPEGKTVPVRRDRAEKFAEERPRAEDPDAELRRGGVSGVDLLRQVGPLLRVRPRMAADDDRLAERTERSCRPRVEIDEVVPVLPGQSDPVDRDDPEPGSYIWPDRSHVGADREGRLDHLDLAPDVVLQPVQAVDRRMVGNEDGSLGTDSQSLRRWRRKQHRMMHDHEPGADPAVGIRPRDPAGIDGGIECRHEMDVAAARPAR